MPLILVSFLTGTLLAQPTGLYVANQGNFSDNNGSVSHVELASGTTTPVIGEIGTLVQSVTIVDNMLYVISNTAEAVDVVDMATNLRVAQIPGVPSPRYMTVVTEGKAYVSNLWSASVTIIELATNAAIGTITVGSNPEDIAVVNERAFVANSGFGADSTLSIIDTVADTLVGTVDLECYGPRHLEVDGENDVWAFCTGYTIYDADWNVSGMENGAVVVVDGNTGEIVTRFDLDFLAGAASMGHDSYYNAANAEVFFIHGTELLTYDTALNEFKETITLSGDEGVGGITFNPSTQQFYAGRPAADFVSAGVVSVHARDGSEVTRYTAGIAPTQVVLHPGQTGTASEPLASIPDSYLLLSSYPNPFNPSTTLSLDLSAPGTARLTIFNALGQPVETLLENALPAGSYDVTWDASGYPSGMYLAQVRVGTQTVTRQLLLAK